MPDLADGRGAWRLESFAAPLVVCDRDGQLVAASAGARELFGFDAEAVSDPLSRALADDRPVRAMLARTRGGLVEIEATPLHDDAGALLGAVLTVPSPANLDDEVDVDQQTDYASDLMMLAEVSRLLAEISDPDEAAAMICTVAMGATGAVAMLLWRLLDGELEVSQHEAAIVIGDSSSLGEPAHPGATRALASDETTIEPLGLAADGTTLISPAGAGPDDDPAALTAWHEPLVSGGNVIGVLTIVFPGTIGDPSRPAALIRSLAQHSAAALDRAELLRQLGEAARTDPLTGVANRRVWTERLEEELLRADRNGQPLSLVTIDIDHFKRYNDTRGHPEGDRLLRAAADSWARRLRRTDLLARVGGEEFAVLLPDCPADHLPAVAESLREAMPEGQTCSIGAVTFDGHASAAELYHAADAALYRAKTGGRNRVEIGYLNPGGEAVQ